ncbi:MAG TPA: sigma 54-interacting transcriptional regulator, partial [Acetobacteraceae bacterium]|nr:sigma 54-interacting transcriptional regulator [Acetobacteraceae bacterium]
MEWAIDDQRLLVRLHATLEDSQPARNSVAAETPEIIGQSPAIQHASELIRRFARTDEPVLITGESGTGKELAARAIHDRSPRHAGPFVAVNCAAFPSTLVASELFGYEKGAFTGAAARTKGQIEHANGGTLFLDEIGDMPVDLQGHLLRFLQEGQIVRVGGREAIRVDVRIVAATNVRLRQAISEGRFREDLYYRLHILSLNMPPLRERPEDIELLAHHALKSAAAQYDRDVTGFAPDAMEALRRHDWPGNVRELVAAIRRAVVIGDGTMVTLSDLTGLGEPAPKVAAVAERPQPGSDAERTALLEALAGTHENITMTAQELGVSRVTLYRMLRRHSISLSRGLKAAPVAAESS